MSAFVCSNKHISVLANYVIKWRISDQTAQEIGEILNRANVDSVNHLYRSLGRPELYYFKLYKDTTEYTPVEILKAAGCLYYQSCEIPTFRDSLAYKIIDEIKSNAIRSLKGYGDAQWQIAA